jgi:hypothetical protein
MKSTIGIYKIGFALLILMSCKKFVDVSPPSTQLVGASVYNSTTTAAAALTGIYQTMVGNSVGGGNFGISALSGLSADEFLVYPNSDITINQTYTNGILSNTDIPVWSNLYNCIYQANSAIEGLSGSNGVQAEMNKQLTGEAKFIRAFCHFYLTNIYGDVPLVTTTDYSINQAASRAPKDMVFDQIITDLKDAQSLLSADFLAPDGTTTPDRVRPNKGAATALLARVYLYLQKWDSAEAEATAVINNTTYQLQTDLNNVFLKNSAEAIWQLEPPNNGFNSPDGSFLLGLLYFGGPNSYAPITLSDSLIGNFEPSDLRKTSWVISTAIGSTTYYYPFKYKLYYTGTAPTEYPVVLRLAEQYLIRSEARAQQKNLSGAVADLNVIRNRAGLQNTSASTQQELVKAIYHERRLELFTEYGHRWLDLKRTANVDAVMSVMTPKKGGTWKSTDQLYPIPLREIQSNARLTQNPGYN